MSMKQEPRLSHIPGNYRLSLRYMSSSMVAGKMRISPLLLSRITGSIQVEMGSPVKYVHGSILVGMCLCGGGREGRGVGIGILLIYKLNL